MDETKLGGGAEVETLELEGDARGQKTELENVTEVEEIEVRAGC